MASGHDHDTPRVVLVNSGKAGALAELRAVVPRADIDVLTETSYAKQYPADVRLHFVGDIGDLSAVRRAALALLAQGPIDHVVAPSERSQQAGGYLRSYLGLPGIPYDTANLFSNKAVMKARLAAMRIPVARHRVVAGPENVAAAAAELGWPVVVKPALGSGAMNTFAVATPAAWADIAVSAAGDGLRRADCPLVVEEFISMEGEYHCDGVVRDGTVEFAAPSRYFVPLLGNTDAFTGSYLLPDGHPDAAEVLALHQRAVSALGLRNGVTHLEAFKTAGGFLVGEIACRPAGAGIPDAIEMQYGIDLWRAFMEAALGRHPSGAAPARRLRDDIVVSCCLPIRPGRVARISRAEELARIPGVVKVRMTASAGDVIGTRLHSASFTGLVFLAVTDESQVAGRIADLADSYIFDVGAA
ncbi:MAG TPA: ATP-grasp domain-containing protein [Streptosporangiaceae bacterium]|jgi:biotin carboxylase